MKKAIVLSVLLLFACHTKNANENTSNESNKSEIVISEILQKMYQADRKSKDLLNDNSIFSKEIVTLEQKCDSVTKEDAERIAKSPYPQDKPIQREGSMVTSLYEGATDFKIKKITINGKKAEVIVAASNVNYKEIMQWNDKIILIDENSWKVDNIFFDRSIQNTASKNSNLKENLIIFSKQIVK